MIHVIKETRSVRHEPGCYLLNISYSTVLPNRKMMYLFKVRYKSSL